MPSVKARAKVIEDNTGIKSEIPVLLTEQGELSSVTDYILKLEAEGASASLINGVLQAISLLLDYMEVNQNLFNDPKILFETFAKRLYSGTIGEDGIDPSGLYWVPTSIKNVDRHIKRLTNFTDWLSRKQGTVQLNPLREATSHERRLNYAAWFRKNHSDFLGHIEDKTVNQTIRQARILKGRTPLRNIEDNALAFPQKHWEQFYREGIGGAKDPRVALRDKLILLLMHGGGLRESEALSLWVTDVFEDFNDPDNAVVRIYNEVEGRAPYDWHSHKGIYTREAYLKEQYGRIPRIKMNGTARLGWKNRISDHVDNYIRVQWFPTDYGKVFMLLWRNYQKYRACVECHHPYAFISFHHKSFGNPYTLNAFHQSYASGLKRLNLTPNKSVGLGPHGHRHNYGRRLEEAELHPLTIRRALHHSSLDSQLKYTSKAEQKVSDELNNATKKLANSGFKIKELDWEKLTEYGFDDIDPHRYFTGKHPKLRGR